MVPNDYDTDLQRRFTAFVARVAHCARIDYLRSQTYMGRETLVDKLPEDAMIESSIGSIDDLLELVFTQRRLERAFTSLPQVRQEILYLTYSAGYSSEEIAFKLNCSVKYVYNHRRYALQALRQLLEGSIDDDE